MAATPLLSTTPPAANSRISHLLHSKRAISLQTPSTSRPLSDRDLDRGRGRQLRIHAVQETKEEASTTTQSPSAEETTEKYGLEFGLWKIFSSKEGGEGGEGKEKSKADQTKELLAKYGGAYLATSITLSLISFTLCYLLVGAGIDVQSLLSKVGIVADETGGKVGTFALAYAAHKAASPIRFPPTVALTPIVATWIGKMTSKPDK